MKKKYSFLIFIVLSICLLTACGAEENNSSTAGDAKIQDELVIGMELAYPPFEMTDEVGNPTGISVDMAQALGKYLDRPVRIENMAYNGLIPSLQSGKVDIIISSMTITDDRLKTVDFSDPYASAYLALLINKDSTVQTVEDLKNEDVVVAVKKGTTGYFYVTKNFPDTKVTILDNENACMLEVVQGKADVFIYDQMTIYKSWQMYKDGARAELNPFQEDPEKWGIAIRKGDDDLREQINTFIKEYKENGFFDDLAKEYLTEEKNTFDELGIPFFF